MTKISVIVPVYNVRKYLSKCLDSLINQTLKDIEIICINDGSTDDSLKLLEEYAAKDSRINVINQQNQGVGAARNRGLETAQGEYVGFCDPDDWVDADFFESVYSASDNGIIDIIKGNADIVNFDGQVITHQEQTRIHKELEQSNIPLSGFGWAWFSAIYKRELVNKFRINFPQTQYLEDVAFLSKMLYVSNSFKLVDSSFYHYFKRRDSLTNKKFSSKTYEHFFNSMNDIACFLNSNVADSEKDKYLKFFNSKVIGGLHWSLLSVMHGIGFENFEYFANTAFDIFYSCKYLDELFLIRNDEFVNILKNKDTQKLKKYLFSQKPALSGLHKIFSVKNWGGHKIYTILGVEFKIPLKFYRKMLKQWE